MGGRKGGHSKVTASWLDAEHDPYIGPDGHLRDPVSQPSVFVLVFGSRPGAASAAGSLALARAGHGAQTGALAVHPLGEGVGRKMIRNALASVPVNDIAKAKQWYERLLGRPADSTPMPELAEWKFDGGGWLQAYQAPERAGRGSFTLSVSDLAGEIARLDGAGFEPGRTMETATARVVMLQDPDGNSIAFAEASDPSVAR